MYIAGNQCHISYQQEVIQKTGVWGEIIIIWQWILLLGNQVVASCYIEKQTTFGIHNSRGSCHGYAVQRVGLLQCAISAPRSEDHFRQHWGAGQ